MNDRERTREKENRPKQRQTNIQPDRQGHTDVDRERHNQKKDRRIIDVLKMNYFETFPKRNDAGERFAIIPSSQHKMDLYDVGNL